MIFQQTLFATNVPFSVLCGPEETGYDSIFFPTIEAELAETVWPVASLVGVIVLSVWLL